MKTLEKQIFRNSEFNLDNFISVSLDYLAGNPLIPVIEATSSLKFEYDQMTIEIYFYDKLLEKIVRNKNKYYKDIRDLVLYGYVGNSRGGKNGLVVVPERDRNFRGIVEKFNSPKYSNFCNKIDIFNDNNDLIPVKAVAHRKSGERMVGVFNRNTREAVLYDVRLYKK